MPSVMLVRESLEKEDLTAELRYELHVCPGPEGLVVHHRHLAFVSLDGVPASDPSVSEAIAEVTPMAAAIPELAIGDDGVLQAIVGWDGVRAALLAVSTPEEAPRVAALFEDEALRRMMDLKARGIWSSWVGLWLGYEPAGQPTQTSLVVTEIAGRRTTKEVSIERLGIENEKHRLRVRKASSKEELRPALEAIMRSAIPEGGAAEAEAWLSKADMRRVSTWEVLTDPTTMIPTEARTEQQIDIVTPEDQVLQRVERHDYRFEARPDAAPTCQ